MQISGCLGYEVSCMERKQCKYHSFPLAMNLDRCYNKQNTSGDKNIKQLSAIWEDPSIENMH